LRNARCRRGCPLPGRHFPRPGREEGKECNGFDMRVLPPGVILGVVAVPECPLFAPLRGSRHGPSRPGV